jgi:glycosyltransferase involved in cell wall biosynthesis
MLARYEAFGLAICEAMAARVPVFGLKGEGEFIDSSHPVVTPDNAVFFPRAHPADQDEPEDLAVLLRLARSIEDYEMDPSAFSEMVAIAREWVADRFTSAQQAAQVGAIYEEIA